MVYSFSPWNHCLLAVAKVVSGCVYAEKLLMREGGKEGVREKTERGMRNRQTEARVPIFSLEPFYCLSDSLQRAST